jgi:hypothetical protein
VEVTRFVLAVVCFMLIRFRLLDGDTTTFTTPTSSWADVHVGARVDVICDPEKQKRAVIAYQLPKERNRAPSRWSAERRRLIAELRRVAICSGASVSVSGHLVAGPFAALCRRA